MWPWEHLAIGYLAYSLFVRIGARASPTAWGAFAVALGSQFPDLIDKPLGWGTSILPSGQSLGHSLLFAVPLLVVVGLIGWWVDRTKLAVAFAIGYLSHLPGDVLYPVLLGGEPSLSGVLWPLVQSSGSDPSELLAHVAQLFDSFTTLLGTPAGMYYLLAEVILVVTALAVWIADGTPGLPRRPKTESAELP